MQLKNTLNIGAPDAARLGIEKVLAGETNDVKKEAAEEMLSRGWAVEPGKENLDPSARPHSSAETPEPHGKGAEPTGHADFNKNPNRPK